MRTILDLPYDVLQQVFQELSPVDVLHHISSSRKLYYPLIDDISTWRPFCTPYGITNNDVFCGRSFRIIYGRLLHKYGPLIGLWCSDYPFKGNIIEFRLLPDHWLRSGEPVIVGDAWRFFLESGQPRPHYPTYLEFMQIGFTPRKKSTLETANDIHISWHLRSERDLGFLFHHGRPPPWVRMDGGGSGNLGTPSLHVIAPTASTLELSEDFAHPIHNLEFPEAITAAWYDIKRGVPRLPQEGPPHIVQTTRPWWSSQKGDVQYVDGAPKPASIAVFPPPPDQPSDVRIPDLHNPIHNLSITYPTIIPRYYPLRTIMQEGVDPASPDWSPGTLVGLWLGDYGPHGTECLFLEHDAAEARLRAWKVTGDVNVPRGACTWHANLSVETPWEMSSGSTVRAFEGMGRIAHHGFIDSSETAVRVIMSTRDEIMVEWHAFFIAKLIRYRKDRGRTGDE